MTAAAAAAAAEPGGRESAPAVPAPGPEAAADRRSRDGLHGEAAGRQGAAGRHRAADSSHRGEPEPAVPHGARPARRPGPGRRGSRGGDAAGVGGPGREGALGGGGSGSGSRGNPEVRKGRSQPPGPESGRGAAAPGGTPNGGCRWGPGPAWGRRCSQTPQDPLTHVCPPPAFSLGPLVPPLPAGIGVVGGRRVCRAKCTQDPGLLRAGGGSPGSAARAGQVRGLDRARKPREPSGPR